MKRLLTLLLLVLCGGAKAQVEFEISSFYTAVKRAESENKLLFLYLYDSRFGDVRSENRILFGSEELGQLMNKRFVNMIIDMSDGEGPYIRRQYDVLVSPTLLIVDSKGHEVSRCVDLSGCDMVGAFMSTIDYMLENSLAKARERFAHSTEGANEFIHLLNNNYLIDERDRIIIDVFKRRALEENYTKENFDFYASFTSSVFHPVVKMIMDDKKQVEQYLGKKYYKTFVSEKVDATLSFMANSGTLNEAKLQELSTMAKKYKEMNVPMLQYYQKVIPLEKEGNLTAVMDYSLKAIRNASDEDKNIIMLYVGRMAANKRQLHRMLVFCDELIAKEKDEKIIARYTNYRKTISRMVN